jgi:hypothetical protein
METMTMVELYNQQPNNNCILNCSKPCSCYKSSLNKIPLKYNKCCCIKCIKNSCSLNKDPIINTKNYKPFWPQRKYIQQINLVKKNEYSCPNTRFYQGCGDKPTTRTFRNLVLILIILFLSTISFVLFYIYKNKILIKQAAKLAINPSLVLV